MKTIQQVIDTHQAVVAKSQAEREAVNQAFAEWRSANWGASEEVFEARQAERQEEWDRLDAAAEVAKEKFESEFAAADASDPKSTTNVIQRMGR